MGGLVGGWWEAGFPRSAALSPGPTASRPPHLPLVPAYSGTACQRLSLRRLSASPSACECSAQRKPSARVAAGRPGDRGASPFRGSIDPGLPHSEILRHFQTTFSSSSPSIRLPPGSYLSAQCSALRRSTRNI